MSVFICRKCGYRAPSKLVNCPICASWGSFVPEERSREVALGRPLLITNIPLRTEVIPVGIPALDELIGGGLPPGSTVLLGGEPGVGKSTLLLQIAAALAKSHGSVLYVSGEESPRQIRVRAERLRIRGPRIQVLCEQSLPAVLRAADELRPTALIVDSLQTAIARPDFAFGSVAQLREVGARLVRLAREQGALCFAAVQTTKGKALSGPKSLEHLVDLVLILRYGEGGARVLEVAKNRHGPSGGTLALQMGKEGLIPLKEVQCI